MKLFKNFHIFIFLTAALLLNANCSTLGLTSEDEKNISQEEKTLSSSDQWQSETATENNTILSLVDGIFGSDKTVDVESMVQVGVKDGFPVYEFSNDKKESKNDTDADTEKDKVKSKKRRTKKIKDKRVRKAIVRIDKENEYLEVVENIRLEKLGYDTETGEHKKLRALKKKGKEGKLVFNEKKETYDVVVLEEQKFDENIDYKAKGFATKEELKSRQGSLAFSIEANAGPKLYAPEYVVDSKSKGEKGAVQLVWTKYPDNPTYEIELLRDKKLYSLKQRWNVMHIMVYWDVDYLWRARVLDKEGNAITAFAKWKPLKIVQPLDVRPAVVKKAPAKKVEAERDAASIEEIPLQFDQGGK